jgi:hypothetical protein
LPELGLALDAPAVRDHRQWMLSRSRIGLRLPAAVLLLQAVSATAAPAQLPRVRDSAGVRIVENGARLKAPVIFRLGTTPLFEVGGLEEKPDVEFSHNQGFLTGARLSGGGLVVIDTDRLQYFDAASRRVRIVGRRGQGPKEFLYLNSICRTRGDTVVVSDSHNHRMAVVDEAGRIVRTFPADGLRIPPYTFCFNDGTLVLYRNETAFGTTRVQLQRIRLDGSIMNQIGNFPTRETDFWTQSMPGVVAQGQKLYYGDGHTGQVLALGMTGSLLAIIRSADPRVRITQADAEKRLRASFRPLGSAAQKSAFVERIRAKPYPSTWPAYDRIHVAPDGTLWIQDYRVSRPGADGWTAFDSSGHMLGRLLIPKPTNGDIGLEVMGFGTNEILLRRRDSMFAVHLAVYPILKLKKG